MSSEDFFDLPPGLSEGGGGSDFYEPRPGQLKEERRGAGHVGRPRAAPTHGTVGFWIASIPSTVQGDAGLRCLEGLALVAWEYTPRVASVAPAVEGGGEAGGRSADAFWGDFEYSFLKGFSSMFIDSCAHLNIVDGTNIL